MVYDGKKSWAFAMSTFFMIKIIGTGVKDYFKELGAMYEAKKTKFEAIKLQQAMSKLPSVETRSNNWVEMLLLPLFRQFYYLFFEPTKVYFLNAPLWACGYQGMDIVDVCSRMTGISSKNLVFLPEMCEEHINKEMHGYTVCVLAVFFTLIVVKSVPVIKYICDKLHDQRGLDRQAMLTMEQGRLAAYNTSVKDLKNKDANYNRRWTMLRHQKALNTLNIVWNKLQSKANLSIKVEEIMAVVQDFQQYLAPAPPPALIENSTSVLLSEDSEDEYVCPHI